jgi:hypothetical protein
MLYPEHLSLNFTRDRWSLVHKKLTDKSQDPLRSCRQAIDGYASLPERSEGLAIDPPGLDESACRTGGHLAAVYPETAWLVAKGVCRDAWHTGRDVAQLEAEPDGGADAILAREPEAASGFAGARRSPPGRPSRTFRFCRVLKSFPPRRIRKARFSAPGLRSSGADTSLLSAHS